MAVFYQAISALCTVLKPCLLLRRNEVTDGRWRSGQAEDLRTHFYFPRTTAGAFATRPKPEGFVAYLLDNLRVLWWNQAEGIQEYLLYRKLENESEFTLLKNLSGDTNQFLDDDIGEENVYVYRLIAITTEGLKSEAAEQVLAVPQAAGYHRRPNNEGEEKRNYRNEERNKERNENEKESDD